MRFLSEKNAAAGLDLGQRWAKLVHLEPRRKQTSLGRLARLAWRREDHEDAVNTASRLSDMWQSLGIKDKKVVGALAGHGVIIKHFDIPAQSQDLDSAVKQQAQEHIPFDLNEVYLDYQFLDTDREGQKIKAVLAASKKTMIEELRNLFQTAYLSLHIVDVEGFALCNCFEYNYPERIPASTYILDIGSTTSIFCVYSQGYPLFIRDLGIGGEHLTNRIAKSLDMNYTEAEQLKLAGPENSEITGKDKVAREINSSIAAWTDDIQRLITLYQNSQEQAETPDKLYIAGGGSLYPGLKDIFASELNLEVEHLNPLRQIAVQERYFDSDYLLSCGPQYAVATGLALRGIS